MSKPGIGAILHLLSGGSDHDPSELYGKTIAHAEIADDALVITFSDGVKIRLLDGGQSCCESRYMTCDDSVESLAGGVLTLIETVEGKEDEDGEYGEVHEYAFLKIATDKDSITICNHNEHNGYYGGFALTIKTV